MPKITFFNLPEDKRENLVLAAKKEFARVPLYQASISNIIKDAKIPRGSFYQYFDDKEDAFFYLLNSHVSSYKLHFVQTIHKNNGDIFDAMIDFYTAIITEEKENMQFLRNLFLNMTHRIGNVMTRSFGETDLNEDFKKITNLINHEQLNIEDEHELFHMMQIISSVTFHNIVKKFARELPFDEAVNNYRTEIYLLKKGFVSG
ncbi:TetR family transcriptional regulator [Sporosarcina globispora]|uniref:TetR family transcriptional regulator n=1 Tax=Sporosarcina globispora TaxID=1459 RepID=A0A0M0GEQ1_SPOGL|nr:TetR/AcrR family transcriptional regulator [Sporosarcina globispora]KON88258.1 TetR family transcriptional regulator [Sporosarcina globispora]